MRVYSWQDPGWVMRRWWRMWGRSVNEVAEEEVEEGRGGG
jgi:hypothetical protein